MLYFAYDADLFFTRFKAKMKTARVFDKGWVEGYGLKVNARSHKDHSGKANLEPSTEENAVVHGVIYKIGADDKVILDRDHGLGYGFCEIAIKVRRPQAAPLFAFTYIANRQFVTPDLLAYTWYRDLMIEGAVQQGLPEAYIETYLKQIMADIDPDNHRDDIHKKMMAS